MAEQENRKKVFIYLVITRWRYPGGKRHLFEDLDARFRDGFHADQTGEQRGSGERKQRESREDRDLVRNRTRSQPEGGPLRVSTTEKKRTRGPSPDERAGLRSDKREDQTVE
jgi:hypothetical protein